MDEYSIYNSFIERLMKMEPYYIFGLVIIGIIGNTISFGVFTLLKFKSEKSNYHLAALALSDNGFLLSLLLVNLRHFAIDIFNKLEWICKLTVYFTYVFGFLSAWFVVGFSVERVIVVYFPIKRQEMCTSGRNKAIILVVSLTGMIFYSFSLITSGLEVHNSLEACVPREKWLNFVQLMSLLDTIIAIIIPFFIIFITNTLIAGKLMNIHIPFFKKKTTAPNSNSTLSTLVLKPNLENLLRVKKSCTYDDRSESMSISLKISNMPNRIKTYSKTTKVLFTISTTYLILHFPIAICKIWYFLKSNQQEFETPNNNSTTSEVTLEANPIEEIIERITCYLYYLNFSLNFFLYNLNGSQFRTQLLSIFRKKKGESFKKVTIKINRVNSKNTAL